MSSNFLKPGNGGLRSPIDPNQVYGEIINPPTYAGHGGLSGPDKVLPSVSNGDNSGKGNPFNISKPGGGRRT